MKKQLAAVSAAVLTAVLCSTVTHAVGDVYFSCSTGEEKKIALTFDDGPHPAYTSEILEILAEYGIRATFFVIGVNAEQYPALVEAEMAAGHEIGNHTYGHLNLLEKNYETVRGEILDMEKTVGEDCVPHVFRPPGGQYGEAVSRAAAELDYTMVLWSVDTRDWAHTAVEEIVENVLTNTDAGDIILFHDYVSGQSPTPEALRRILPELISRGFEFVTVSELLAGEAN